MKKNFFENENDFNEVVQRLREVSGRTVTIATYIDLIKMLVSMCAFMPSYVRKLMCQIAVMEQKKAMNHHSFNELRENIGAGKKSATYQELSVTEREVFADIEDDVQIAEYFDTYVTPCLKIARFVHSLPEQLFPYGEDNLLKEDEVYRRILSDSIQFGLDIVTIEQFAWKILPKAFVKTGEKAKNNQELWNAIHRRLKRTGQKITFPILSDEELDALSCLRRSNQPNIGNVSNERMIRAHLSIEEMDEKEIIPSYIVKSLHINGYFAKNDVTGIEFVGEDMLAKADNKKVEKIIRQEITNIMKVGESWARADLRQMLECADLNWEEALKIFKSENHDFIHYYGLHGKTKKAYIRFHAEPRTDAQEFTGYDLFYDRQNQTYEPIANHLTDEGFVFIWDDAEQKYKKQWQKGARL